MARGLRESEASPLLGESATAEHVLEGAGPEPLLPKRTGPASALGGDLGVELGRDQQTARWGNPSGRLSFGVNQPRR